MPSKNSLIFLERSFENLSIFVFYQTFSLEKSSFKFTFINKIFIMKLSSAFIFIRYKWANVFSFSIFELLFTQSMPKIVSPFSRICSLEIFVVSFTMCESVSYVTFIIRAWLNQSSITWHVIVLPISFIKWAIVINENTFSSTYSIFIISKICSSLILKWTLLLWLSLRKVWKWF